MQAEKIGPYNAIIREIKEAIIKIDASARVILFGSHASGTARADSDWDILILVDKPTATIKDEQFFRHKLYDVELETGQAISTFVYSVTDWNTRIVYTPLYQNIKKEGVAL